MEMKLDEAAPREDTEDVTDTRLIPRQDRRRPHEMVVRLDAREHRRLRALAAHWNVPRSVALRRLILEARAEEEGDDGKWNG